MAIIELPKELVEKIAAGEVIERPANCVKELVENAIDAGAKRIDCKVIGSGVEEIIVSDDGCGMSLDEILLAIKPHTTSKIQNEEDLYKIRTFGFRGEALPSICRVAEVEIYSKPKNGMGGYVKVMGGDVVDKHEIERKQGTTVKVKNLFYNLPARRKFLKSEAVELKHIQEVIENTAIAYPNVNFTLTHNGKSILNLVEEDLNERIENLYSHEVVASFTTIDFVGNNLHIKGYISKPTEVTYPIIQKIFVNKRPCRENTVKKAIREIYGTQMKDKEVSFIIFIDLPPEMVDVNVHPRKEEVRFRDEESIRNAIIESGKNAIGIRKYFLGKKKEEEIDLTNAEYIQFYNSYILVTTTNMIFIIDQHAAHERILFEKAMKEKIKTKMLLFPLIIELKPLEKKFVLEYKEAFDEVGFNIEDFGGNTLRISGIPTSLENFDANVFTSMIYELQEFIKIDKDKIMSAYKTIACKSAIKSGEKLSYEEMKSLVQKLFDCETPYFCPHGRPTMIKWSKNEFESKFSR